MDKNLEKIKFIAMDVDGVLTDGRVILGKEEELKFFDIRDGMGITLAQKSGLKIGIITGRNSDAVKKRAKELKINYVSQGCKNKLNTLQDFIKNENINFENVCYIGDDIIDIAVFRKVGFSATVADAPDYVKSEVKYISKKNGGRGAVREIIDYILKEKEILKSTIDSIISEWSN